MDIIKITSNKNYRLEFIEFITVKSIKFGGLKGYSDGKSIRP